MTKLKGKVVLITGSGKGRGKLLAQKLAERGAIIAANDISPINIEPVVQQINQQGGIAKAYIEDVAKKVGVQNLINQVEDDYGRIDILINHAAVQPRAAILEMDEWDWHRVLDVNLTGTFLMTQSAGRVMREAGGGVIINFVEANQEPGSAKREAAFLSSMEGLRSFTRQAAQELSSYHIQVYEAETVETAIKLLEEVA